MLLYFGPSRGWRYAQSPRHRKTVYTYWTTRYAEKKMRKQDLSGIKRVWTDVIDYRFRNDSFTNGSATLYGKLAGFLEKWSKKLPVRRTVVLTCKTLEKAAFPRNIGLVACRGSLPPGVSCPEIDYSDTHSFMDNLVCPLCKSELKSGGVGDTIDGWLTCPNCRRDYPIVSGVPEFLKAE